eukprot:4302278-Alexandrium_andersonii.AAC.1
MPLARSKASHSLRALWTSSHAAPAKVRSSRRFIWNKPGPPCCAMRLMTGASVALRHIGAHASPWGKQ